MNCSPQWSTLAVAWTPCTTEVLVLQRHNSGIQYQIVGYRNKKWLSLLTSSNYLHSLAAFESLRAHLKMVSSTGTTKLPVLPSDHEKFTSHKGSLHQL